jgi:hypothetical protein
MPEKSFILAVHDIASLPRWNKHNKQIKQKGDNIHA